MKALFVSPVSAAYGSERSMLTLLRARSFDAEVVCPGGGALERELRELGLPVHQLEFGKYSLRQNPLWHLGFYRRFQYILRCICPDVVVVNLDGNTPWVTLAAVRAGIAIVRFCRFEFRPPTRGLDRWCWLRCRAVICPSDHVKNQLLRWSPPGFHSRVYRLYEAYEGQKATPAEVAAFRSRYALGKAKVIGCFGRLHPGKRIDIAMRALAELRRSLGDVQLLVVGGHNGSEAGAAYEQELRQLAQNLKIAEAVTFTGYLPADRVLRAIASCDVCVLPSESESFGMVLMEAWAQGVPTVASDVGACQEITASSGAGILVPLGDVNAFSQNLLLLLREKNKSDAMGRKGSEWVAEHSSPSQYAAGFSAVLSGLHLLSSRSCSASKSKP